MTGGRLKNGICKRAVQALFDTSVLVPTFLGDHEHHEASLDAFLRFGKRQACCAAHSLAEVYATLTRMPGKYRVSCEQAMLFLLFPALSSSPLELE